MHAAAFRAVMVRLLVAAPGELVFFPQPTALHLALDAAKMPQTEKVHPGLLPPAVLPWRPGCAHPRRPLGGPKAAPAARREEP